MTTTMARMTGHLAMFQTVTARVAEPDRVADGLGDRAADDERRRGRGGHDDEAEGDEDLRRGAASTPGGPRRPGRPGSSPARTPRRSPRRRTGRSRCPMTRAKPAPRASIIASIGPSSCVGDLALAELADDVEHRLGRRLALPEDAEERDEREERREDREHRVVGEGRGEVGALVALELRERRLGGVPPAGPVDVGGGVGLAGRVGCGRRARLGRGRVRRWPCVPPARRLGAAQPSSGAGHRHAGQPANLTRGTASRAALGRCQPPSDSPSARSRRW